MIETEAWGNAIEEYLKNTDNEQISILMTRQQAEGLARLLKMEETDLDFEKVYFIGYEHGYQYAIKDVIKHLRGMRWYGGDKQEKRADRMSGDHAGRVADLQQKLERAGTKGRNGGRVGAGPAED